MNIVGHIVKRESGRIDFDELFNQFIVVFVVFEVRKIRKRGKVRTAC